MDAPNGGGGVGGRSDLDVGPGDLKGLAPLEERSSRSIYAPPSWRVNAYVKRTRTGLHDSAMSSRAREKHRHLKEINRDLQGYRRALY